MKEAIYILGILAVFFAANDLIYFQNARILLLFSIILFSFLYVFDKRLADSERIEDKSAESAK